MSDTIKLGSLPESAGIKDAVHVAVISLPVLACVQPGQHVGVTKGKIDPEGEKIGVVDPFLAESVPPGGSCYLLLYPNTVTSVKHDWSHPAFQDTPSEKAIKKVVSRLEELDEDSFCCGSEIPEFVRGLINSMEE